MNMIRFLQRTSTWKYIVPLFLLFCGFTFYLFPHYQSRLNEIAGDKVKILDTRFSYTRDDVINEFKKLKPEGRKLYTFIVGRIDMAYPLIYGLFFILILAYLFKKTTKIDSKVILIALLPALGMLFDYLENMNTLHLLKRYPAISVQNVARGEQMTRMKHGILFISMGLTFFLAVALMFKKIKHRKNYTPYNSKL